MASLIIIYLLCALSGVCIERRLEVNGLVKRIALVFALGASQLMLSVELLSLGKWLTGSALLAVNAALAVALAAWSFRRGSPPARMTYLALRRRAWAEIATLRTDLLSMALLGISIAFWLVSCSIGWLLVPTGDTYHFEMPLFWIEHQSVLPFPVHNPRIVALSFLTEVMGLPGFLYLRSPAMSAVLTLLAGTLVMAVITALARRLGAGLGPAISAAAISVGYTRFALEPMSVGTDALFAGAWFGASLLFLLEAESREDNDRPRPADYACSVFCFVMACGAKNSTALLAPLYLITLAWVFMRRLNTEPRLDGAASSRQAIARRAVPIGARVILAGVIGLLCSGVAWNYACNQWWFGNSRGPTLISETTSTDFHPRSIWTRLCRGATLTLFDTIWIPNSASAKYAAVCEEMVALLGGRTDLTEDNDYYTFKQKALTPRKGMGLLGIAFFLPALFVATLRSFSRNGSESPSSAEARFNVRVLVMMTVGAFVMSHLVLRWQSIGMLRLVFPFTVAGAPLASLLLTRKWMRAAALVLLMLSCAALLTLALGNLSRRHDLSQRGGFRMISRLQNVHGLVAQVEWQGGPPTELHIQEDYNYREVYSEFLKGIQQPAAIGLVGFMNAECTYLFGPQFQNRVVPLVDARVFDRIMEPPLALDYVVAVDKFAETDAWARRHGFNRILSVTVSGRNLLAAYKKDGAQNAGR